MNTADGVWNRALDYDANLVMAGDVALRDVVTLHGSVKNGGLTDALQSYESDEEFPLDRVIAGYEYLGFAEVAALIASARPRVTEAASDPDACEDLELTLDPQYDLKDEDLTRALRLKLEAAPGDFAPV